MRYTSFMEYTLTEEQYETLKAYFELALTAISSEDDVELVSMEPKCREIMRGLVPTETR